MQVAATDENVDHTDKTVYGCNSVGQRSDNEAVMGDLQMNL